MQHVVNPLDRTLMGIEKERCNICLKGRCAGSVKSTEWFKKGMSMSRSMRNARAFW